jgi:hypothetical protein
MDLNAYLMSFRNEHGIGHDGSHFPLAGRITCNDDFSLSVQASKGAYCSPRKNIGPWYEVEVGFPSAVPELILQHAENPEDPTETVYGYVPIELVEQLIELHGGMKHPQPA